MHTDDFYGWKNRRYEWFCLFFLGCTPRGSCNNTLLRRVLGRISKNKCFLEGFLVKARFLEGFLEGRVFLKALRRCLEGRNKSFRRVRPPSRAPHFQESMWTREAENCCKMPSRQYRYEDLISQQIAASNSLRAYFGWTCLCLVAFHPRPQSLAIWVATSPAASTRTEIATNSRAGTKFWLMAADSNRSRPQPAAIWESQAQPAPFYRWSELLKSQTRRPQSQN